MELILCQIDINDYYNLCLVTVFQLSEYSLFFKFFFGFFNKAKSYPLSFD